MGRARTDPGHARAGSATVGLGGIRRQCQRRLLVRDLQRRDEFRIVHRDAQGLDASSQEPFMLILDSLPAHKGKAVKNYIESTNGKLELHYLPG